MCFAQQGPAHAAAKAPVGNKQTPLHCAWRKQWAAHSRVGRIEESPTSRPRRGATKSLYVRLSTVRHQSGEMPAAIRFSTLIGCTQGADSNRRRGANIAPHTPRRACAQPAPLRPQHSTSKAVVHARSSVMGRTRRPSSAAAKILKPRRGVSVLSLKRNSSVLTAAGACFGYRTCAARLVTARVCVALL